MEFYKTIGSPLEADKITVRTAGVGQEATATGRIGHLQKWEWLEHSFKQQPENTDSWWLGRRPLKCLRINWCVMQLEQLGPTDSPY